MAVCGFFTMLSVGRLCSEMSLRHVLFVDEGRMSIVANTQRAAAAMTTEGVLAPTAVKTPNPIFFHRLVHVTIKRNFSLWLLVFS